MAGVTDTAFRQLRKAYGADIIYKKSPTYKIRLDKIN